MIPYIIHGSDPTVVLKMEENFTLLRKKIENGLIQSLVKKYFIDNTHGVRTIITPDHIFTEMLKMEENEYLKALSQKLTVQDISALQQEVKLQYFFNYFSAQTYKLVKYLFL